MLTRTELTALGAGILLVIAAAALLAPEPKDENSLRTPVPPSFTGHADHGWNAPGANDVPEPPQHLGPIAGR